MDAQLKQKWVDALRSGGYQQGQYTLKDKLLNQYCCLGVLCDLQGADFEAIEKDRGTLRIISIPEDYRGGLSFREINQIANLNDGGLSFAEIAHHIEKHL